MHRIAVDAFNEDTKPEEYWKTLDQTHEKYYRNMKGTTGIQKSDVRELIEAETQRQRRLYDSIEALAPHFNEVTPLDPTGLVSYPYWDHSPSHGVNVEINGSRFYALPLVPCSTAEYVTVKQDPVPASVVLINKDMILMLPYREGLTGETQKQLKTLLNISRTVTEEKVEAPIEYENNYLKIHSEEKIEEPVIRQLIQKHGVDAFMVGYPSRNLAIIYTGMEDEMESLWKTMYFEWNQMWRRYGWYE